MINDVLSLPIPKIEYFWMDLGSIPQLYLEIQGRYRMISSITEVIMPEYEMTSSITEVIMPESESKIAECDVLPASLLRPGLVRRLGCGVSLPPSLVSLNP